MAEERIQRRLAAILAADVVGYGRLVREDEEGTLAAVRSDITEAFDPNVTAHNGRIFKTMGDGLLVEFASVVDSVRCAVEVQRTLADRNADRPEDRKIDFRIGVNLGDVVVEGDDLHGDGVNIAARLEGLADPGGIFISGTAFDQIQKNVDVGYEYLGEREVKNIADPIRVYRVLTGPDDAGKLIGVTKRSTGPWKWPAIAAAALVVLATAGIAWWQPWAPETEPASIDKMAFKLPDKPSIAVLPFTNMSDDKAQEYFADGITEDIITDLSKVSGLFVIARNSTFTYKGKAVKVKKVAQDLGVRYVLEGSVRRSGDKIRITAQLIDAVKGHHLWAERYDRDAESVFAIQDEIAAKVAAELAVTLKTDEQGRLFRRHTNNLEAYETYLRARRLVGPTRDASRRSKRKRLLERVIELDPGFAAAYAQLSLNLALEVRMGQSASPKADVQRLLRLAQKAVATDESYAGSYVALGTAHLMKREHDKAVAAAQEAVRLEPSFATGHAFLGTYLHWAGRGDEAIESMKTAMRLEPNATGNVPLRNATFLGYAYFTAGRYDDAISTLDRNYEAYVRRASPGLAFLAAAYTATGQDEKAHTVMKAFLDKKPGTRCRTTAALAGTSGTKT